MCWTVNVQLQGQRVKYDTGVVLHVQHRLIPILNNSEGHFKSDAKEFLLESRQNLQPHYRSENIPGKMRAGRWGTRVTINTQFLSLSKRYIDKETIFIVSTQDSKNAYMMTELNRSVTLRARYLISYTHSRIRTVFLPGRNQTLLN